MSLQFILGGSGSGKTHRLYTSLIQESIKRPEDRFIVLVPEQFTMQTQKEIVTLHPRHGVSNIDIVSFQRLAFRIFEELSVKNPSVLDDMGKAMVLRKVAAKEKKNLVLYKDHFAQNGFIAQMKSMLSELYQYGITPDRLKEQIPLAQGALLKQKLQDITVLYEAFRNYIQDKYITTEEILDVLCRVLPDSRYMRNAVVTLDGFTGFTPVQYRLIELFLKMCRQVTVTVTIDPSLPMGRSGQVQELFYMSRQMISRLNQLAADTNTSREKDLFLTAHPSPRAEKSKDSQSLDFLEQNLYRFRGKTWKEVPSSIELRQYEMPSKETAEVLHSIEEAVQREGLRYRDMAVITGDLGTYGRELARQFEDWGIPYFLDDKKSILKNPMVELIRSALEIIQKDFSYESVFRYLRTGLVLELSQGEQLDRLENYVIALGIRGLKRWDQTWESWYRGGKDLNLEEMNHLREDILGPLRQFYQDFCQDRATVRTMTAAVAGLLTSLDIERKMKEYQAYFENRKEYGMAKEYSQVYGLVMDLFDRLVSLLGEEAIGRKEYAQILDAGFSEVKVGVIPATVDRVVVGDITRTRLDHIKILFFVGVNDGIVPVKKENGSLFTDREREFLESNSVELAPTVREESFRQRFYLYLALTKPEQKLILSCSASDSQGKALRPSTLMNEMRKLFPGLSLKPCGPQGEYPLSLPEAKRRLTEGLREWGEGKTDLKFLQLYKNFALLEGKKEQLHQLVDAAFYSYVKKGIGKAAAKALYGSVLSGSVTRLEQYASCAYAHFLSYGLELMERQEFQLAAVDMGNLFHNSIDLCFQRMREEGRDWRNLGEEERKELVHQCVTHVTEEYGNTILKSSARNSYLAARVEKITDRTIWALAEQLKKGDFVPVGFEVSFSAADNLKAMKIPLSPSQALHLRGRIDRMDVCQDEDKLYVKIIDYKSGGTAFDLTALYYGIQLQLVVYMDAALEMEERRNPNKEVIPAGIFYYNIGDPIVDREDNETDQEQTEQRILRHLRMNGLVNSSLDAIGHLDREIQTESQVIPVAMKNGLIQEARSSVAGGERFEHLRKFVRGKLKEEGKQILAGDIDIAPYRQGSRTACDYCPYHSVCGFELKTDGYAYRKFKSLKPEEIWQEISLQENNTGGNGSGSQVDEATETGN
ncbi:MAG TPA: helicase-exonuclease AddAB subunit AddB [Candidatus Hungatella pullicola]|nr:helicase-exonuclease AddAB subunit AddB [Candidatus Hungatella pullicola]